MRPLTQDRPSPRVTVVVIFFDERRFLTEAIESVVAQEFDEWELLLCDDGSTDGSGEIAREWADHDPRISVLAHPGGVNRGMSATRNLGLRNARGEFVALLDADDAWMPDKLRRQVEMMDAHAEVAMVCGASEYWRSWAPEASPSDDVVVPLGTQPGRVVAPPQLALELYPLGTGAAPCPSDLLLRRSVIEAVGGFEEHFEGELQLYEDQGFLAKVYLGYPVYVATGCSSRYRQRPDSCVATVMADGGYHRVRAYFLDWFERYVDRHDPPRPEVRRLLESAGRRYDPVTVIVPTKNRPVSLQETLGTVLAQRGVEVQVVVVDDGGDVGFRIDDDRVRVVRHAQSLGVSAARNRGIDEASTPWIAFCDDDDLWSPDKLARQMDALAATPDARWCAVGSAVVDKELGLLNYQRAVASGWIDGEMLRSNQIPGGGSGVVVATDLVREAGGFDPALSLIADWDVHIRLSLRSPLAVVEAPLLAYVKHDRSMSRLDDGAFEELAVLDAKYADERRARGLGESHTLYRLWVASNLRDAGDRKAAIGCYVRAMREDPSRRVLRPLLTTLAGRRAMRAALRRRVRRARQYGADEMLEQVRAVLAEELPRIEPLPVERGS